jgi:hypothetical protein
MKKNLKKTFAFVMVLALTLTMFSGTVLAKPGDGPPHGGPKKFEVRTGDFDNGKVGVRYGGQYKKMGANETHEFSQEKDIDEINVTAIPNSGYKWDDWVDNTPIHDLDDVTGEHYRDTKDVRRDRRITPSFVKQSNKKVKLTVFADPANGGKVKVTREDGTKETVSNGTTIKTFKGEKVKLEAIPTSGADQYKFVSFGGDISDTDNPTKVKMDSAKEVVANFRPKVYPVLEFVVDNGDGTYSAHFGYNVRGNEDVIISVGNKNKFSGGGVSGQNAGQPITFTAGRRYDVFAVEFDGSDLIWKLDGSEIVASVVKTELRFTVRPELFTNGDLVVTNENTGGDTVFDGATFENDDREIYVPCYTNGLPTKLEFEAIPDAGLGFIEWDDNNSTKNPKYVTFDKSWLGTKKMIRRPDPVFETGEVILTIIAEEHGSTSISQKVYDAGDVVDISAIAGFITADAGYDFAGFEEATADFIINESTTLTAMFVADESVVLTILTDGNGTCSQSYVVYDTGSLVDLTDIIALLTPNSGYIFDGFEEKSEDFYINVDTTITATFTAADNDVPKTGDESKDLSAAWIIAMILPLLLAGGYVVATLKKQK